MSWTEFTVLGSDCKQRLDWIIGKCTNLRVDAVSSYLCLLTVSFRGYSTLQPTSSIAKNSGMIPAERSFWMPTCLPRKRLAMVCESCYEDLLVEKMLSDVRLDRKVAAQAPPVRHSKRLGGVSNGQLAGRQQVACYVSQTLMIIIELDQITLLLGNTENLAGNHRAQLLQTSKRDCQKACGLSGVVQ